MVKNNNNNNKEREREREREGEVDMVARVAGVRRCSRMGRWVHWVKRKG